jgi:hypothetical protein
MLSKRWTRSERCRAWARACNNNSMESSKRYGKSFRDLTNLTTENFIQIEDASSIGSEERLVNGICEKEEGSDDTWGFFIIL